MQPPKGLSAAQKQAAAVTWLRNSRTVHSIKELEKAFPSVASVNGMQLKDFVTSLQNENMITVEKIGSGNWYWNFASDEVRKREAALEDLNKKKQDCEKAIEASKAELGKIARTEEEKAEHQQLMAELESEKAEVAELDAELDGFRDGDPAELERKRKDANDLKTAAECWTDNIYILESQLAERMGGDREALDNFKKSTYGDEYVEGEGLKEWIS